MDITVIVCTYNRCHVLANSLETVLASNLPKSIRWEVLVVDNNSNDDTRQVVAKLFDRHADRLRYLFEPRQGLSRARNTGIERAFGKIIVFTDDDVAVDSEWLHNLTRGLSESQWAGAGGRVLPRWASSPPNWLPLQDRYALAPLAVFDPAMERGPLTEAPFGANMAFRCAVFEKYGVFREDLGRSGDNLISNEETEFCSRLFSGGEQLLYEPSAVVYHPVSANRIKKEYFLSWWQDKARSDVRAFGLPPETKWFVAGIPLHLFRRLTVWTIRWLSGINPASRFRSKTKVWSIVGTIGECHRLSRRSLRSSPTTPSH